MTSKSTKKLSRKEAWLYLAKLWAKSYRNHHTYTRVGNIIYGGLCPCIRHMYENDQIAESTRKSMDLAVLSIKPYRPRSIYRLPPTVEGAKMRAAFCRKQARKIKIRLHKTSR